jgi:branched-chain amino acid transport system permease protein
VRFGSVTALDAVDLEVAAGTVHALIGPNGAGKSTLVDAVTGFIADYDGEIFLGDARIDRLSATRRARAGIRRTFQQGLAIPTLTVQRYIELSAHRRLGRGEVADLMAFLDGPPPGRTLADVEVGTRRIVEVAAGLAARPRILLLDEPGAGLATEESLLLGARMLEIPQRFGCSVLLIDHDMELVKTACSAITVLDFGRVIASGEAEDVFAHTAVIDAYLGAEEASLSDA